MRERRPLRALSTSMRVFSSQDACSKPHNG
jgi:hypothetical protein